MLYYQARADPLGRERAPTAALGAVRRPRRLGRGGRAVRGRPRAAVRRVRPRARVHLAVPWAVESLTADLHQCVLNHSYNRIYKYILFYGSVDISSAQDEKLPNREFLVASIATEHKHKRTNFALW